MRGLARRQGTPRVVECRLGRRDQDRVDTLDLRDDAGLLLWRGMLQQGLKPLDQIVETLHCGLGRVHGVDFGLTRIGGDRLNREVAENRVFDAERPGSSPHR